MADDNNSSNDEPSEPRSGGRARYLRMTMMVLGPIVIVAVVLGYYITHRGYESTDDAYVQANIVQISPRVSGRIAALPVDDYQQVSKGDVLIKLDPASYKVAVSAARAELAQARDHVGALKAQYQSLDAHIDSAKSQTAHLEREVERNRPLARKNIITSAKLDNLTTQLEQSRQQIKSLQAQRRQVLAQLGGDPEQPVQDNSAWRSAKAALKQARINLEDTVIRAPADGRLGHVGIRVGDTLSVGQKAFPLIESDEYWVKANFKETQLTHMQPGQPVKVSIDTYPDASWNAHVDQLSPASGAVSSLLPPQNASGNWVKVVQRIPVRITLDHPHSGPQLRAGMSAEVTVHVAASTDNDTAADAN